MSYVAGVLMIENCKTTTNLKQLNSCLDVTEKYLTDRADNDGSLIGFMGAIIFILILILFFVFHALRK